MTYTKYYYVITHILTLYLSIFITAHLFAQDNKQQTYFDRISDDRFLFTQEYEDQGEIDELLEREPEEERSQQSPEDADTALHEQNKAADDTQKATLAHCSFFRFTHNMHKGVHISAGMRKRGYIGILQLESPEPMPYFELSVKNFALGLYPLADVQTAYPEKNIPTVFLGVGCLNFDTFLQKAQYKGFSNVNPSYGGITFPRAQFIGIGSTQKAIQYGFEVYHNGWNGTFFASPEPVKGRMRYALMGGWRIKREKKANIHVSIQHITAFIPKVADKLPSSVAPLKKRKSSAQQPVKIAEQNNRLIYHKLFGLSAVLTHPIISLAATSFLSYAADANLSGSIQAECDLTSRFVGIRTGASYTGTHAINWDGKQQHERITAFIQPYIKTALFSLATVYTLNMEQRIPLHNGGVNMQVKYNTISCKIGWNYRNKLHTLKTELMCTSKPTWFTQRQWFKKACAGTAIVLHDRSVYTSILKKYTVYANSTFCIAEGFFCGINGSVSQAVRKKEKKTEHSLYLQRPVYRGGVSFSFKRNGIETRHSGTVEIAVKNEKPHVSIKLGYQVNGK